MRSTMLCVFTLCLGLFSVAHAKDDDSKFKQLKFSMVDKRGVTVEITVAANGSATLVSSNLKEPVLSWTTTAQLKKLNKLVADADIAHVDSQINSQNEILMARLTVVIEDKTYSISAPYDNYGEFQEQIEPLIIFLTTTEFPPYKNETF